MNALAALLSLPAWASEPDRPGVLRLGTTSLTVEPEPCGTWLIRRAGRSVGRSRWQPEAKAFALDCVRDALDRDEEP